MKDWLSNPWFWIVLTLFSGAGIYVIRWIMLALRRSPRPTLCPLAARVKPTSAVSLKQAEFLSRTVLQVLVPPSEAVVLRAQDFQLALNLAGVPTPIIATNLHRRFEFSEKAPNVEGNDQTLKLQGPAEFHLIAHFMHDVVPESRSGDARVKLSVHTVGQPKTELSAEVLVPRVVIGDIVRWETPNFPELPRQ